MDRIFRKIEKEDFKKDKIFEFILKRYSDVCGNYGKRIFEERVLPNAYKILESEPYVFALEMYILIKSTGRKKISEIEDYLSEISLDFEKLL